MYRYDDSGNMVYDGTYAYGYDPENRLVKVRKSGPYGTLTLGDAMESPLTYTTGGNGNWTAANGGEGHEDLSAASSPSLTQGQQSWLQTTVEGAGTFSFWAKLDPYYASNALEFYVDGTLRYSCDSADWEQFSWAVTGAGTHTLKWVYRRNSQSTAGTGYVDDVGWTGSLPALPPPEPAATNWRYLEYTYDASGRRIEKKYDYETVTKYVYDGDQCIAEYNAYNQLKRKYIYGPGVDEPVCMIDSMASPAVMSYYHFDALGSVVALTNASGNTVEVYEYDVYGRVGASDANHPNRIMFTGREYDKETGLYYYRARYYKPEIGRFLQVDPVGYDAGMNLYRYCSNNPWNSRDPDGKTTLIEEKVTATWTYDEDVVVPRTGQILHIHKAASASLTLSGTSSDHKHFDGNPPATVDHHMSGLWFYHEEQRVPEDASYSPGLGPRPPDTCDVECYRVTATFTWSLTIPIVPKLPIPGVGVGLPGVSIERHMTFTIYAWICADGARGHKITGDSNNGWKTTSNGEETNNWPSAGGDGEPDGG